MRRLFYLGLVALLGLTMAPLHSTAKAIAIRISPVHERVAGADCVIVGKVSSLDKNTVAAKAFVGATQKTAYQIASVKITDPLFGVKGVTDIRVGWPAPMTGAIGGGIKDGVIRGKPVLRPPFRRPIFQVNLTVGQEGVLFLTKHFDGDFYTLACFQGIINKQNNANYANELKLVKRCIKLLDKPMVGLKSKESADRLLAATMLITKYRTVKQGMKFPYKTQAIDAKESKAILDVLTEADWGKFDATLQVQPLNLFQRLELTVKDGWENPKFNGGNYVQIMSDAGKAWIKKHGEKYRIQKYVMETTEK